MERALSDFKKEVYIAYGLKNEVLYVGQGNIGRSSHCYSGASHNKHLNRYYFLNGEDGSIRTEVYTKTNCERDAVNIEIELIKKLSPICNNNHQPTPAIIRRPNFAKNSEEYYNLHLETLICKDNSRLEEIKEEMKGILNLNTYLGKMLEHLHIDEIKGTGFNKTKSQVKYEKAIGVLDIIKGKSLARKGLKVKTGEFLTYAELKERIQNCFKKHDIKATAKATDIKLIFNVKRTARNGVEGFLIGDRI